MSERFFYITFVGIYFLIWLAIFIFKKNVRGEMLSLGLVFGVAGVLSQIIFIIDWWQPSTITGTRIGIEDFLVGFFIGGVLGAIYEALYQKRLEKVGGKKSPLNTLFHWSFLGIFGIVFFASFFFFKVHSFYASLIVFGLFTPYILFTRRDLIRDSLISGILSVVVGTGAYLLLGVLFPDFIVKFWYLPDFWFSRLVLDIPLAEYIWYFFAGAFIGPLYEYLAYKKIAEN